MKITGPIWALGTMSGTSLDGVDAAMLRTDGLQIYEFGESRYRPYSEDERAALHAARGAWPDDPRAVAASEIVETAHAALMADFPEAELIAFHGQTLAHDPRGRGTHQAGNGALLAAALGKPVVWDFRSADVAMGGEGAPLAPFYHFACAQHSGATAPMAFLNLGGVANLTWVDPACRTPEDAGACLAFDTGPANAPLNDLMMRRRGVVQDEDGALAASGKVDEKRVAAFMEHPHFPRMPPKSLDRDAFSALIEAMDALSDADAAATLVACTVAAVSQGLTYCPSQPSRVLISGGGRFNGAMTSQLASALPCPVAPIEEAGFDGDMVEAQAFAFLAVRVAHGLPTSAPGTTGVAAPIGGGTLSRPQTRNNAIPANR